MTTILYAAPFDAAQLKQLNLPANEYDTFRATLGMLQPKNAGGQPRLPAPAELQSFCDRLAHRQFEPVGRSGIYRHPIIPELCCVVMVRGNGATVVPGNNVMLVRGDAFQWTFFQKGKTSAEDRVKVINGGNTASAMPTPIWVPQPEADKFFTEQFARMGENVAVLNLKRGGTRLPNLPPSAYQAG
jgi:hypothetical protein